MLGCAREAGRRLPWFARRKHSRRMAFLILLVAMLGSWLFRAFLLKSLRIKHPSEFAALGYPSSRKLASLLPRHQEMHLKFWNFLWGGKFLQLKDRRISRIAFLALISDVAMAVSVLVLVWSAWK